MNDTKCADFNPEIDQQSNMKIKFLGRQLGQILDEVEGNMCILYKKCTDRDWEFQRRSEISFERSNTSYITEFDVQFVFERKTVFKVNVVNVTDLGKLDTDPEVFEVVFSTEFNLHSLVAAHD